jgi:hypothetical protein
MSVTEGKAPLHLHFRMYGTQYTVHSTQYTVQGCLWAAVCLRTMLLLSGSVRPSVSHPGGIGGVLMPQDRMRTDGELV